MNEQVSKLLKNSLFGQKLSLNSQPVSCRRHRIKATLGINPNEVKELARLGRASKKTFKAFTPDGSWSLFSIFGLWQ